MATEIPVPPLSHYDELALAALQLVQAIHLVQRSPEYKAVFELYRVHGLTYSGPDYAPAVSELIDVLRRHRDQPNEKIAAPSWRCFHCDEMFTDWIAARNHFGYTPEDGAPSCRTTRGEDSELYHMKRRLESYQREDTELHRALHAKDAEMHTKVCQAEEQGYARGLEDTKKHPETIGLQRAVNARPVRIAEQELERIGALIAAADLEPVEHGCVTGRTLAQHGFDFINSLSAETAVGTDLHGVYLTGTSTIVCHTGNGPRSEANARLITFALNNLPRIVEYLRAAAGAHALLSEAKDRAEQDLMAVGHQPDSEARTASMRDLRNWIARLKKAQEPTA